MFLLSHQAYNTCRIPGLNANSAVFVCLPATVMLPVHSVCKLFSTVAAVSSEPAASPMPKQCGTSYSPSCVARIQTASG
jgi:hypothetical protein